MKTCEEAMKTGMAIAILTVVLPSAWAREYHVSPHGNDTNAGTTAEPLRTVSAAARLAQPGDVITVHEGVYRERISPQRGGESDQKRIVYQAAPGEKVVIKGSEIVKGWEKVRHDTWKVVIPNGFFGDFNPYKDLIRGDWFTPKGREHHTGAVYVDGHWLTEAAKFDDVLKPTGDSPLWFAKAEDAETSIWAQFRAVNPNEAEVEINVRQTVFYPDKPGRNYITVRGFTMMHAATPWAPPTAEQIGLIGTHWSKGWIIENNDIQYSTCVGITLGKHGDEFDNTSQNSAEGYVKTIERGLANGWSRDNIGHHVVRNNRIAHCEQAGIVGSLGAAFSTITCNHIHDIHVRQIFSGAEMAGIKFHGAIDTEISRNRIHRTCLGIWLDWMTQGTRVVGNLLYDNMPNNFGDLLVEVNHGPFLVDNNLFLSPGAVFDESQGGAYVHNLMAGRFLIWTELKRDTPYLKPHSTQVAGLRNIPGGDNRFYNNIFVSPDGLSGYDKAALPMRMGGNVFLKDAMPGKHEKEPLVQRDFDPAVKLVEEKDEVYLHITLDKAWAGKQPRDLVTTELLGKAAIPDLPYEKPDGSPYRLDTDYFGGKRNVDSPYPGPFELPGGGRQVLKVWPPTAPAGADVVRTTAESTQVLENEGLRLEICGSSSSLLRVVNRQTGETFDVAGDKFAVHTLDGIVLHDECRVKNRERAPERVLVQYVHDRLTADVEWRIHPKLPFAEKQITVTFLSDTGWKRMIVSRPSFTGPGLRMVCYRYPSFDRIENTPLHRNWKLKRPPGTEPVKTYFGRTGQGGFFTGLEMPFDSSTLQEQTAELSFSPSLKMKAGERHVCESMYIGVYIRGPYDARANEWRPADDIDVGSTGVFSGADAAGLATSQPLDTTRTTAPAPTPDVLPLPSESAAMTAMASAILGPPRHGVMAIACAWHCQMEQAAYDSDEKLEGDLRSLEFLAACGLDGVSEPHPWGGETAKMAGLREGDRYVPDARVQRFLEHARKLGLKVVQWPTMNNTHPWKTYGGPFRLDRPEWLRGVEGKPLGGANADNYRQRLANCLACEPFFEWLIGIQKQVLATGYFDSWAMDGDFWGTGAYYHTTIPVTCMADNHRHLPGDSNYACQRALDRLIAEVRRAHPDIYIAICRPPMDLGLWSNRNVDACFTLIETGTGESNIAAGDEVRTASRIRVHHHFFPHTLDLPLLFPSYGDPRKTPKWPSSKIDYAMLSALSCAPNMLLYLPTKTGIPEADKAEIRKWIEWGRKNEQYLLKRHDLADWPGKGRVDGSAHLDGDHGLIFLFNSGQVEQAAEFSLTLESTGFAGSGPVEISQEYPLDGRRETHQPGRHVRWPVPAESVVLLRMRPLR